MDPVWRLHEVVHTFDIGLCWQNTPVSEDASSEKERQWEKMGERSKESRVRKRDCGRKGERGGWMVVTAVMVKTTAHL